MSLLAETATAQVSSAPATIPQDERERKNAISLSVLALGNHTYSFTYARKLKNGNEITLNPLMKIASGNAATEPAVDKGSNHRLFDVLVKDPQWFYTHYMFRVGLRMPIGPILGYEPQLQLGYGEFLNKVIETEDAHGDAFDEYLRLDRKYFSAGIINMINWVRDYRWLRVKGFVGLGIHLRRYEEMQWARYVWYRPIPFEPQSESYYRPRFSFHVGMEMGIRY